MAYYVDTSAFLKLVVGEQESDALRRWAEDHDGELFSSDLLRTEALRAARRHSLQALAQARHRLDVVILVTLTPSVFERAAELDPSIPRSLDAVHLAAALAVDDDLEGIATYDERLSLAASLHGVAVFAPT